MPKTPEFEVVAPPSEAEGLVAAKPFALTPPEPRQPTFAEMIEYAVKNAGATDVIERLAALQRDERDYQARVSFDEALSRCQSKMTRISADLSNEQTRSRYASYAKLDRVVRPIYTAEGFSISFGERDCPYPGKTRFVAYVSRAGITREYLKDMTPSTKGPKGNDVMTPIHAEAASDSYAKRYLLKDIFNLAIGEDDEDGNPVGRADPNWLNEQIEEIKRCETVDGVKAAFRAAAAVALDEIHDLSAYRALKEAAGARGKYLEGK